MTNADRLLAFLDENPGQWWGLRQIALETGLSVGQVNQCLHDFLGLHVVESYRRGNELVFRRTTLITSERCE